MIEEKEQDDNEEIIFQIRNQKEEQEQTLTISFDANKEINDAIFQYHIDQISEIVDIEKIDSSKSDEYVLGLMKKTSGIKNTLTKATIESNKNLFNRIIITTIVIITIEKTKIIGTNGNENPFEVETIFSDTKNDKTIEVKATREEIDVIDFISIYIYIL